MDLSFSRFDPEGGIGAVVANGELAVLMVGIAARQATSPTALIAARAAPRAVAAAALLAPADGAFNGSVAQSLSDWQEA